MLIQFRGKIPLTIYPTFWLFAALIGYLNSMSFVGTLMWIGIIFVSVLFHEMGHALTALLFKQHPRIELVALGGLTYHDGGARLSFWKQFFIVFNGPLFGLILALFAQILLQVPVLAQGMSGSILSITRFVNIFWTLVNLVPVFPLDGGQLLRLVCEKCFGVKGFRYAIIASLTTALLISLAFFVFQGFLIGALFFLFAFQSYDLLRKMRHFSKDDQRGELKEEIARVDALLQQGHKQEALQLCQTIRSQATQGVIFELATQTLALLQYEKGNLREVYQLLIPLKGDLAGEPLCLLQSAAFEQRDYPLVIELSGSCFQVRPTVDTALLNAYAHAQLRQVTPALGWLQTALDEGLEQTGAVLASPLFDPVRTDPLFKAFQQGASRE